MPGSAVRRRHDHWPCPETGTRETLVGSRAPRRARRAWGGGRGDVPDRRFRARDARRRAHRRAGARPARLPSARGQIAEGRPRAQPRRSGVGQGQGRSRVPGTRSALGERSRRRHPLRHPVARTGRQLHRRGVPRAPARQTDRAPPTGGGGAGAGIPRGETQEVPGSGRVGLRRAERRALGRWPSTLIHGPLVRRSASVRPTLAPARSRQPPISTDVGYLQEANGVCELGGVVAWTQRTKGHAFTPHT